MALLKKVNDFLELICRKLAGFTLSISVHVLLRAGFSYPLSWAQDAAVMLFVWMVFIGAPVALRKRSHFNIDLLNGKHPYLGKFLDVLCDAFIYVFLYVMIVNGSEFLEIAHTVYYSYLYLPQSIVVVAIPLSGLIMAFINTENLLLDLGKLHRTRKD